MQHHVPRFHVRPAIGLVNDPNGPVMIDGVAHLYFQFRSPIDDNMFVVWGHATSDDLVRWTLHRPALVPDPLAADHGGCWSGNTVLHDGVLTAYYSGYRQDHPFQSALAADSIDGGATFGPPRPLVADPGPAEGVAQFRDPFVWRQRDAWWLAVGAGGLDDVASARLYRSEDLADWTYVGPLATATRADGGHPDPGVMWECPQVLDLGGEDVLLVGAWSLDKGLDAVLTVRGIEVGADPGPLSIARLDAGPSLYAASGMRESPWGPVVWGWVMEDREQEAVRAAGWSGTISLPRSVRLGDDGTVRSFPLPTVDALRAEPLAPGADLGAQVELVATVPPAAAATVRLRFGAAEALELRIGDGRVVLDRSASSTAPAAHRGDVVIEDAFAAGEPATVRLFVDGSVLEVFTSAGRVATTRVYPVAPPPWRLEVEGDATVAAWRLSA